MSAAASVADDAARIKEYAYELRALVALSTARD
jgi:hypothetical protein